MKKRPDLLFNLVFAFLVMIGISSAVSAAPTPDGEAVLLHTVGHYGSVLGTGADNMKKVEVYYYGADNNVSRAIVSNVTHTTVTENGESVAKLVYEPFQYYRYRVTPLADGGRVVDINSRKNVSGAGSYDEFDRYWQDYSRGIYSQETYDKDGVLVQSYDTNTGDSVFYNYQDGNLVEKVIFYYTSGALNNRKKSIEKYSNFVEGKKNCPQSITISSRYAGSATVAEVVYDGEGRMVEKITYKAVVGNANKDGLYESNVKGDPKTKEQFTYDANGELAEHLTLKYTKGEFVNSKRIEYIVDGMSTKVTNYEWGTSEAGESKWLMTTGTFKIYEKSTYLGSSALKNLTVTQSTVDLKQFILTADMPANNDGYRYDVYRDGFLMGQMTPTADGTLQFEDNNVYNGLHDWFVQTVRVADGKGLNISNAVELTVNTNLAPVTITRITSNTVDTESGYNLVDFEWDAPETEGAVLLGYNFYANVVNIKYANPQNTELLTERKYSMKWQSDRLNETNNVKDYYVEAVYDLGKVKSEKFEVTLPLSLPKVYIDADFNEFIPAELRAVNLDGMTPLMTAFNTKYIQPTADWFIGEINGASGKAVISTSRRTDATKATSNWLLNATAITLDSNEAWVKWRARSVHHDFREAYRLCVFTKDDMSDLTVLADIKAEEYEWTTRVADLSAYAGQTVFIAFEHYSTNKYMLAFDNLFIGDLPDLDITGHSTTSKFTVAGDKATIGVCVENHGRQLNIIGLSIYSGGQEIATKEVGSFERPYVIAAGQSLSEELEVPLTKGQRMDYTVKIIEIDESVIDAYSDFVVGTAYPRTMVVEKYTGMWCNSCPSASPFVHGIESLLGDDVAVVEVHGNTITRDKLANEAYCQAATMNNYPTVLFDRALRQDGGFTNQNYFKTALLTAVEASVNAEAEWTGDMKKLEVKSTVQFANALDNSADDYRVGYIFTEDNVSSADYFQQNNSTTLSDEEYRYLPATITGTLAVFNNVARGGETTESLTALGMYNGVANSLPADIRALRNNRVNAVLDCPASVLDKKNLSLTVVVFKNSTILNAHRITAADITTGIDGVKATTTNNAVKKYVRDGQIVIQKGGKLYNIAGQQIP